MSVKEIERAISELAPSDLAKLAEWFEQYHAEVWDKQIERDYQEGRLDALIAEANREFEAGRCKPL